VSGESLGEERWQEWLGNFLTRLDVVFDNRFSDLCFFQSSSNFLFLYMALYCPVSRWALGALARLDT